MTYLPDVETAMIHLIPVLLGEGRRLFEHLGADHIELEPLRVLDGRDVTHLRYRVCQARSNSRISAG